MELKLYIYDGKKIEKTYTADTFDCSFGVIEDILNAINFDGIRTGDRKEIAIMMLKCSRQLKPFLKDIFSGLTDEELRKAKMRNIADIFVEIYDYAIENLSSVTGNEKN